MTVEFTVPGMTCGHCVKTITAAVQNAVPGARVATDLQTHRVTVEGAGAEQARAAIEEAGYEVQAA
jgi:copper chaperone